MKTNIKNIDVVIIGGGPAGLTGALTLARGGRTVIIFDEGKGRNAPARHMQNFPSRDGTPPNEFREQIKSDLKKYKEVSFQNDRVEKITRNEEGFLINGAYQARRILLAHGVKDILPPIPGMKELWGKSIFHCPYCHGHEYKGKKLAVMGDEIMTTHMYPLLKGLSSDVMILSQEEVQSFIFEGDKLEAIKLTTGKTVERDALLFRPKQELTSTIGIDLGCELNESGLYKLDNDGMTTQSGIYAAGDIADPRQSVLIACASAMKAAASINYSILAQDFKR